MNREIFTTDNLTDEQISEMFSDYVTSKEDEERHTQAACKEADAFELYCDCLFPGNTRMQTDLYDKMMDVAVEFEESGFVAGVKWILDLLKRGSTIPSDKSTKQGLQSAT